MNASRRSPAHSLLGFLVFLVLWETVARTGVLGTSLPALSEIAAIFQRAQARDLFLRSITATTYSAAWALLTGTLVALALTFVGALAPPLSRGLDTLASAIYAIPAIAFGPVLILLAGPQLTPIALGALSTYLPIHVALGSQLRYGNAARRDLAHVTGTSRARMFALVDAPAAIPAFLDGLRLAAPAALLGVVLGEWFGAPRGLGVVIISGLQNVAIPQIWAAAVLAVACSLVAYIVLTIAHRLALRRFAA